MTRLAGSLNLRLSARSRCLAPYPAAPAADPPPCCPMIMVMHIRGWECCSPCSCLRTARAGTQCTNGDGGLCGCAACSLWLLAQKDLQLPEGLLRRRSVRTGSVVLAWVYATPPSEGYRGGSSTGSSVPVSFSQHDNAKGCDQHTKLRKQLIYSIDWRVYVVPRGAILEPTLALLNQEQDFTRPAGPPTNEAKVPVELKSGAIIPF